MERTNKRCALLSRMLLPVLVAVIVLTAISCGGTKKEGPLSEKTFTFLVETLDGETRTHTVTSTAATVGEALLAEELIAGEDGPYGLYVKTVDGIFADYNETGTYWAFYEGDSLAARGVDQTVIQDGATYAFRIAK